MANQQPYYCRTCKTRRPIKDVQYVTLRNGMPCLKGQCVVCGATIVATLEVESIPDVKAPEKSSGN